MAKPIKPSDQITIDGVSEFVNLESLLERGGYIRSAWVEYPITWNNGREELTFKVQIKSDMSAADHEFVFLGLGDKRQDKAKSDASFMARRVHRMVQIFNPASGQWEPIALAVAERMRPDLLLAICNGINEVTTEPETEENAEKN